MTIKNKINMNEILNAVSAVGKNLSISEKAEQTTETALTLLADTLKSNNIPQTWLFAKCDDKSRPETFYRDIENTLALNYFGEKSKNYKLYIANDLPRGSEISAMRTAITRKVSKTMGNVRRSLASRYNEDQVIKTDGTKAKKSTAKKERIDTTPKTDKEKVHAQINNAIVILQNSKDQSFNKVAVLVLLQQIVNLIK
jgi:hypothetical protein